MKTTKTNKKTITIPRESTRIMQEFLKFSEYFKKHTWKTILLSWFMQYLDDNWALEVTEDWLYKIKDWVKITYQN